MRLVDYLMGKPLYIGFRVEISNRFCTLQNLVKKYNSSHQKTQIFDLHKDGKITVEKKGAMLIARGATLDKGKPSMGLVNFSIMAKVSDNPEDIERLIQIVNVLGNDRLIRERVATFMGGRSMLNAIPELDELKNAITDLESVMPGFVKAGWYYAPEAILK